MSSTMRRVIYATLVLSLFAIAAGGYLVISHADGGDYLWIGMILVAWNSYNFTRVACLLWEDRHG